MFYCTNEWWQRTIYVHCKTIPHLLRCTKRFLYISTCWRPQIWSRMFLCPDCQSNHAVVNKNNHPKVNNNPNSTLFEPVKHTHIKTHSRVIQSYVKMSKRKLASLKWMLMSYLGLFLNVLSFNILSWGQGKTLCFFAVPSQVWLEMVFSLVSTFYVHLFPSVPNKTSWIELRSIPGRAGPGTWKHSDYPSVGTTEQHVKGERDTSHSSSQCVGWGRGVNKGTFGITCRV